MRDSLDSDVDNTLGARSWRKQSKVRAFGEGSKCAERMFQALASFLGARGSARVQLLSSWFA